MTGDAPPPRPDRPRPRAQARSAARLAAVQALYAADIAGDDPSDLLAEWPRSLHVDSDDGGESSEPAEVAPDQVFLSDVVRGAHSRRAELTALVSQALPGEAAFARTETLLRAIFVAGSYELAARFDVPARVVIDEYVRLARGFYHGAEPGLVNAVLDRIARDVRPTEMSGLPRSPKRPS